MIKKGRKPNKEKIKAVHNLRKSGLSIVEIAKILGCTRQNIQYYLSTYSLDKENVKE